MVFNNFIFSLCSFFGLSARQTIKASSLLEANVSRSIRDDNGVHHEEPLNSPGGSKVLREAFQADQYQYCCICLSRLKKGAETRILPCTHEFHRACINTWLTACRETCPVCRFALKDEKKTQKWEELTEEMVIWFSSFHGAGF